MREPRTTSQGASWMACQEKFYFENELCIVPRRVAPALTFGTFFHSALEVWLQTLDLDLALEQFAKCESPIMRVHLECLMRGYHDRWVGAGLKVLAVEHIFKADMGDGCFMRGKVDAVVELDGVAMVMEHKTTSADISPGSNYWAQKTLDPQVSNYIMAMQKEYPGMSRCVYDVIGKVRLKQRNRESLEEYAERITDHIDENVERYYARRSIVRLEGQLERARQDFVTLCQLMDSGLPPVRNPASCTMFNSLCAYHGVCAGTESLADETRFRRKTSKNEELQDVTNGKTNKG